jgi:hypothetical protein
MNKTMSTVYEKVETFTKSFTDQTMKKLECQLESRLKEINNEQLAAQSKIKILLEIEKKRRELFDTKGFVTKEDMILIENSYHDQLNQLMKNYNYNNNNGETK